MGTAWAQIIISSGTWGEDEGGVPSCCPQSPPLSSHLRPPPPPPSYPHRAPSPTHLWTQALHPLKQDLAARLDLLLTREEEQHVTLGLREVDLHDCDEGCVQVVTLGGLQGGGRKKWGTVGIGRCVGEDLDIVVPAAFLSFT